MTSYWDSAYCMLASESVWRVRLLPYVGAHHRMEEIVDVVAYSAEDAIDGARIRVADRGMSDWPDAFWDIYEAHAYLLGVERLAEYVYVHPSALPRGIEPEMERLRNIELSKLSSGEK